MFLIIFEASLRRLLRSVRALLLLLESKKPSHLTALFNAVGTSQGTGRREPWERRCSVLYFLWKHDTFLPVYCTLLNNSYLGIYLYIYKKKQTKHKAKKGKKKRKKEKKIGYRVGLESNIFHLTQPYLTTTPLKPITYLRGKDFNLMPFVWHFRRQTALTEPH